MAENIRLIEPDKLKRNRENPRLIFRKDDMDSLRKSIALQGILVPLTVFRDKKDYFLLDGERRWRCAMKLGLSSVPIIVQPKPDRLQNIMMMFAIHNARRDWDPLPTAYKLRTLERIFTKRNGREPTELELAGIASLSRGEVRRLKKLLDLPKKYRIELLKELKKPRSQQEITVDHVLETTRGVAALKQRRIVNEEEEELLRSAVIKKFRLHVIKNTVAPRKLARLARAVERGEVSRTVARNVTQRLIEEDNYSIDDAFESSIEAVDFQHGSEQLVSRLSSRLQQQVERRYELGKQLRDALVELRKVIGRLLSS